MSTRRSDVYAKSNKPTSRYYTVFSNSKYHSSSILTKPLV